MSKTGAPRIRLDPLETDRPRSGRLFGLSGRRPQTTRILVLFSDACLKGAWIGRLQSVPLEIRVFVSFPRCTAEDRHLARLLVDRSL